LIEETAIVRKITAGVEPEVLQSDLALFCQKACEWGATEAKIIAASEVIGDARVRAKCLNPKSPFYGTNRNSPPYTPDLETVRKTVNRYQFGILVMTRFPREDFDQQYNDAPANKDRFGSQKLITRLEELAFHSGYYLAMGFADGPCKERYCPARECGVLSGKGCRMGLNARSAMESWGMDAYQMAARAGWELYPVGVTTQPADGPFRVALGLGLVY